MLSSLGVGPIPRAKLSGEYSSSKPAWKALLPDGKLIEAQFDSKTPYSVTLAPHVIDDELYPLVSGFKQLVIVDRQRL